MLTPLHEALTERGYTTLTDVQEAVAAPELAERDLLVSARTGSGKTVGFGLAIAPTLLKDGALPPPAAPLALVVAPTRELALQVQRELSWLYEKTGALVVSCIGGMDARSERRALERGAHIVVGTPGRLRDHIERGALDLASLRAIVLDEADEMLDLGFREDLEFMLSESPATRRTLLFSATVPPAIARLAESYQRDAERITTQVKGEQHTDIEYQAVQCTPQDVEHAIINLLRFHDAPTAIVFANTRATVARLTARLANRGFAVVSLSGELSQDERSHALQALRDGRAKVCVATDVAARGIDLPNLDLVVHADLPSNTETLTHRSGRTGRAGRKGISALIASDRDVKKAQRLLGWAKVKATWTVAPSPEEIAAKDEERLLASPAWTEALSPEEQGFAERLITAYAPEQIAAACLRMYLSRLSAPEDLNAPGTKPDRAERAPFGPSKWVALSAGRDQGAEPRWLLPLILRAGNLDKAQIGRIRVEDTESFVEVAEAALPSLLAAVDGNGILEKDITLRAVAGEPSFASRPRDGRPAGKPGGKPGGKRFDKRDDRPRPERAERSERPARPDRDEAPRKDDRPRSEGFRPQGGKPRSEGFKSHRSDKPRSEGFKSRDGGGKPKSEGFKSHGGAGKPRSEGFKSHGTGDDKPRSDKPRPDKPRSDKPRSDKPRSDAPADKRPRGAMDPSKPLGKRAGSGGPGKSFGKPGAKPAGKPFGKPGGKPGFKGKAGDGGEGSGFKPRFNAKAKGGDATPRRKPGKS
ncbi:DEAD/DEAH box helicase [Sagittula salina]|uniref:DEAD/DEAH box helicase n=1 Tax=Sagittula salina TaxID=2820268 RepID=A0A940S142_9RHOB|nr:DEAD/DEAH box helicase [Sagittula salina]MBP0482736.1 DEAD/DEAH box helicase [Sagittula salina]